MRKYTVAEYARLTGKSTTAIYKSLKPGLKPNEQGLKQFETVENGIKYLCFPDDVDPLDIPGFQPKFRTKFETSGQGFETGFETSNSAQEAASMAAKVETLEADKRGLTALLEAKEAHIQTLTAEVERLTAELEQERKASQELRQLMNQQQALTMKHLEGTKRRPLLAAIFPRWYEHGQDHQVEN